MITRSEMLAQRVEEAHKKVVDFIEGCSDELWETVVPSEGRTVGTVIHHIAAVLPAEVDLTKTIASGNSISGVTMEMVDQMNTQHAHESSAHTKEETLILLKEKSSLALAAIRAFTDEELDRAAPVSLHWDAPLTAQYFIEAHPISHPYQHLASIKEIA